MRDRTTPCPHGITALRCSICDGPEFSESFESEAPLTVGDPALSKALKALAALPVKHPDDPRAKLREPPFDPEAPGAFPDVHREGRWLGVDRRKYGSDAQRRFMEEADDATNATAAERFRREYIGTWASTEPPPMRMCQRLHVPSAVLIHGDRGSGRTHTLLDLMGERLRHMQVAGDVRPFLFVCTSDRLRLHLRDAAVQRGIDMRHFKTPQEL